MSYCPDCGPEWATCQYCDAIYCENGCSYDQLNICEGEGCERRNCNHGDCMTGIGRVHNVSIGVRGEGRGAKGSFVVIVWLMNAMMTRAKAALAAWRQLEGEHHCRRKLGELQSSLKLYLETIVSFC